MTQLDAVLDRARHPDGIHRDQYKRPIIYTDSDVQTKCNLCGQHITGEPYQRMTTFIDVLEDRSGLHKYDLRQVVKGMALRSDLVLKAASEIDNNKTLGQVAEAAQEAAGSSAKATSGTAVHTFTEAIDRGEYPLIPPQVEADVAAYRALLLREQLTPELVECHIVIDGLRPTPTCGGISGKFDRVYSRPWPCPTCGSRYVIGDVKTGKLDYNRRKFPMQLAGYASGKLYNPRTGQRAELGVCQCWAAVVHMPVGAGVARLEWANLIGARGGLVAAYNAWLWRQVDGLMVPSANQPEAQLPAPPRTLDAVVPTTPAPPAAPELPARGLDDAIPLAQPVPAPVAAPQAPAEPVQRPVFRSPCSVCPPDSEVLGCPEHGGAALHALIEIAGDHDSLTRLRDDAGNLWNPLHTVHAQRRAHELDKAAIEQRETSEEPTSGGVSDETGEPGPIDPLLTVACPHCEADKGEQCRTPAGGRARAGKGHKKRRQAFEKHVQQPGNTNPEGKQQ